MQFVPYSPRLPFLRVGRTNQGTIVVENTKTNTRFAVPSEQSLHAYAASVSSEPGYSGLGDLVHSVARRLGFGGAPGGCEPCAKRQAALNARFPRVLRRR